MDHGPRLPLIPSCDTAYASAGATRRRRALFAKNSDRPPGECQPLALVPRTRHPNGAILRCQTIEIPQVAETARVLGSRPVWLWGFEHGVNEHGVAIGNETIFAREPAAAVGLLGMDLVRLGLERSDSAGRAVEVIAELIERHGQGGSGFRDMDLPYNSSFLVADPHEAWILEATGRHWAARRCAATDAISNHVSIGSNWERLSRGAGERARELGAPPAARFDFAAAYRQVDFIPPAFSEGRLRRSQSLLAAAAGGITPATMRGVLRDHGPSGCCLTPDLPPDREEFYTICMHQGPSRTTASLVAELAAGREPAAWASFGRPCASVFFPVAFAGELPDALTRGSDEPSSVLWWIFEELAAAAEASPDAAQRIRAELDELEAALDARLERERDSVLGAAGRADERAATAFMAEVASAVDEKARALRAAVSRRG